MIFGVVFLSSELLRFRFHSVLNKKIQFLAVLTGRFSSVDFLL